MSDSAEFIWPEDDTECANLARSLFIGACVESVRYWQAYGSHFVQHAEPDEPFIRPWSPIAKRDQSYRAVFTTLTDLQKAKVVELLEHCIRGVTHSALCTLDQFPHGEAEVYVWDGVCGEGNRRFRIAPEDKELHDDFAAALRVSDAS